MLHAINNIIFWQRRKTERKLNFKWTVRRSMSLYILMEFYLVEIYVTFAAQSCKL